MTPKRLFVLFDGRCGLCRRVADWLRDEPTFVRTAYIPYPSRPAIERFPDLFSTGIPEEVLVVTDEGMVYRGEEAWIMCLYATCRWRELSITLAQPGWRPFLRQAMDLLARNRFTLSNLLRLRGTAIDPTLGTC